jgi:hypothetical protein
MLTERGWVNTNTGNALKAATNKILGDLPSDADVRTIDVDMQIRRYNNLHPGDLSPESLATYAKRVKAAINHYTSYVKDPTKYKAPGRPIQAASTAKKHTPKVISEATDLTAAEQSPPPAAPPRMETFIATESNLALPFPLRAGYLAQIVIPRDMTKAEAARLCAFIQTLAVAE